MPENPLLTARRTETVVLYPGDIEDRVEKLKTQINEATDQARSDKRMRSRAIKLAEELDGIREDPSTVEGARVIVVGNISKKAENQLVDEHLVRKGNEADEMVGYNIDTFPKALVQACLISPEVTAEQFEEWAEAVSPHDWDTVWGAVRKVNHGGVQLPKSSAVSVVREILADD